MEEQVEEELPKEQQEELKDLLSHPGFRTYQRFVDERIDIAWDKLRSAKNWEEHVEAVSQLDLLEYEIKNLIQIELGVEV